MHDVPGVIVTSGFSTKVIIEKIGVEGELGRCREYFNLPGGPTFRCKFKDGHEGWCEHTGQSAGIRLLWNRELF